MTIKKTKTNVTAKPKPEPAPSPTLEGADLTVLLGRWAGIPPLPRVQLDARAAASFVLSEVMPQLADKALLARFLALPKTEWNPQTLTDLPLAAQAGLAAATELGAATARIDSARLPEELVVQAVSCKARMLRVLDYLLGEDEVTARELAAIRQGTGYLDLAQDLAQLAKLYVTERAQLQKDRHLYQQSDETLAAALSQRVFSELRREEPTALRERLSQAIGLLLHMYSEVAATAHWLLRHKPDEASRNFPSLITATRRPARKTPNSPTDPSEPA